MLFNGEWWGVTSLYAAVNLLTMMCSGLFHGEWWKVTSFYTAVNLWTMMYVGLYLDEWWGVTSLYTAVNLWTMVCSGRFHGEWWPHFTLLLLCGQWCVQGGFWVNVEVLPHCITVHYCYCSTMDRSVLFFFVVVDDKKLRHSIPALNWVIGDDAKLHRQGNREAA